MLRPTMMTVLVIGYALNCFSQTNAAAEKLIAEYQTKLGSASQRYSGPEYLYNDVNLNDHIFYETPQFDNGTIYENGIVYHNVPLAYDILRDIVVTLSYDKSYKVAILRDKLDSFVLRDEHFVRLLPDSINKITAGYYRLVYQGQTPVYSRVTKKLSDNKSGAVVKYDVSTSIDYLVGRNGRLTRVVDAQSAIALLNDHGAELNEWLRKNPSNFKLDKGASLAALLAFYDQISAQ